MDKMLRESMTVSNIREAITSLLKYYLLKEDISISDRYRDDIEEAIREQYQNTYNYISTKLLVSMHLQ